MTPSNNNVSLQPIKLEPVTATLSSAPVSIPIPHPSAQAAAPVSIPVGQPEQPPQPARVPIGSSLPPTVLSAPSTQVSRSVHPSQTQPQYKQHPTSNPDNGRKVVASAVTNNNIVHCPQSVPVRPPLPVASQIAPVIGVGVQNNIKPQLSQPAGTKQQSKKKKPVVTMATTHTATPAATQGENTGRWTAEEHRLFLQGLEKHGKGWKKIASLIKSRTVVQIRTHAQKYFQKLAKARQNGEEGDVSMENRERTSISTSSKRKRGGTKRKAIQSVVASAEREGKRRAAASKAKDFPGATEEIQTYEYSDGTLPTIAAALAPFIYQQGGPHASTNNPVYHQNQNLLPNTNPNTNHGNQHNEARAPSITTADGTFSIHALEDSLFRFLTPAPNAVDNTNNSKSGNHHVNDIARQAGANSISVPSNIGFDKNNANISSQGGDVSPTGVVDFEWAWNTPEPTWYNKGADVDELLNEAEALDWLADSGDINESYTPPPEETNDNQAILESLVTNIVSTQNEAATSKLLSSEPSLLSLSAEISSQHGNSINIANPVKPYPEQDGPVAPSLPSLENQQEVPQPGNGISPANSALNMPPLPAFFESNGDLTTLKKSSTKPSLNNLSSVLLFASASDAADAVASDPLYHQEFDEQAFVTALLEQDSNNNLL